MLCITGIQLSADIIYNRPYIHYAPVNVNPRPPQPRALGGDYIFSFLIGANAPPCEAS
jgi:hypothetical protein